MRVAIIGPICKDINIVGDRCYVQPGGVAYYTGQALAYLGIETVVFGTHGPEDHELVNAFKTKVISVDASGTIKFENEYPNENNYDNRLQRAEIYDNLITTEQIQKHDLSGFDYIILGPLLHGNITLELIENLSKNTKAKLILAAQGMIRHLEDKMVILDKPENALNVLKFVDYVFMDVEELKFISQENNVEKAAKVLRDHGAKNIVVTQGMHGSWLFPTDYGNIMHKIRAFKPKPLADPTGAGDSYMAGFIAAQSINDISGNPAKQGEFAAMTATLSIENNGPFRGTKYDVLKRLGWEQQ